MVPRPAHDCLSGVASCASPRRLGQILSTDLVISLSLFLAAMLIFMMVWSSLSYSYWEQRADMDMQSALISTSDSLVLSAGTPSDWEFFALENASSLGLSTFPNSLSRDKLIAIQRLFTSNYTHMKDRAGAGRFDMFVSVLDGEGSTLYSFGRLANFTDRQVSAATSVRLCTLDGSLVRVKVLFWRIKGGAI